jgi:GDPmannose 4,6-dehydratase
MNSKIIVTGVTGQDGSHLVDYLLKNTKHKVIGCFRRLSVPNYTNIEKHFSNERFERVYFDLTDAESIQNVVRKYEPDYFINVAAQSYVGASWEIPTVTWNTNATAILHILEAIRKFSPKTRFYNAGTSEEFGNVLYSPQDELHPIRPRSPYGAAKAGARHLVKVYRESYNLYAVQGWLFNHEGERRGPEFVTRKITKGVALIRHFIDKGKKPLPLQLGNLDAQRDWGHAEDYVDGIWRMVNQEEYNPNFDVPRDYVIATGEAHTIREFLEKSFKYAGVPFKVLKTPVNAHPEPDGLKLEYVNPETQDPLVSINPKYFRPAEVKLLLGSPKNIENDLKWNRKVSFDDLVKRMIDKDLELVQNFDHS